MIEVPITDSFDDVHGEFHNYTAYDITSHNAVKAQRHCDIADMRTETWTNGTVAADAARRNYRVVSHTLSAGATTLTATLPATLDLDTDWSDTDVLSVALPAFPAASLTLASSFVDLTSHASANFTTGPTASITLNGNLIGTTNRELRIPISAFRANNPAVDFTKIKAIRFRLQGTGAATLRIMAVRLLNPAWQYPSVDLNTQKKVLVPAVPLDGDVAVAPALNFPRLFRSSEPTSEDDPRPVDASIGVVFYSGECSGTNRFVIYFRELVEDYLTQLDINGFTQEELNDIGKQPDTGDGKWDPRELEDFEGLDMEDLEGDLMQDLERTEDYDLSSWFAISFQWGADRVIISGDAEDNGIAFEDIPLLTLNQRYLCLMEVEEHGFRVRLYPVTSLGVVQYDSIVYDTLHVIDDFLLKRRKGRIGFEADLDDGSAYIEELRTRDLNFAEYKSQPYESITPVEGAQIYAEFPPDEELFTTLDNGTAGGVVSEDTSRANSDKAWKIHNPGTVANSGARSNVIVFENFNDYEVAFDLWYPGAALADDNDLALYLVDDFGNKTALNFGSVTGDTWNTRKITPIEGNKALTGRYYLSWEQADTGLDTTYWLDNISVKRRSMRWEARAATTDPWEDSPSTWVDFRGKVNNENHGVLFFEKGKHLQVRGKALRQNVTLGQVQTVPKYAELGRVNFNEQYADANSVDDALEIIPGQAYQAACEVRSATTTGSASLLIYFRDAAGTTIAQYASDSTTTSNSAWTQLAVVGEAPAKATSIRMQVSIGAIALGSVHYVDKAQIKRDTGWVPGGTAPNILTLNQSSVETDVTGFAASVGGAHARSTARALVGNASLQATATGGVVHELRTLSGTNGFVVTPNTGYHATVAEHAAVTPRGIGVGLEFYNAGGTLVTGAWNTSTNSTAWRLRSYSVRSPATAAFGALRLQVGLGGDLPAASEVHYFDRMMVRTLAPVWVPGNSPDNLLTANQASFESDVREWAAGDANTAIASTTAQASDGSRSMQITCIGSNQVNAYTIFNGPVKRISSALTTSQFLRLATSQKLDRIEIDWGTAPGEVGFQGSADGHTWSPIVTENITTEGWTTTKFASKPTWQYIRFAKSDQGSMQVFGIRVRPALLGPTASFSSVPTALTVAFDGSGSSDPDNRIIAHIWNFGDGGVGYGQKASHKYTYAGSYQVTLTVMDATGLTHSLTQTVGV